MRKINIEKSALNSIVKCIVDMNTVMLDCLHSILCIFDRTAQKENVKANLIMCLRDVEIHMMIIFGVATTDLMSYMNARWEKEKKKRRKPISSVQEIYQAYLAIKIISQAERLFHSRVSP